MPDEPVPDADAFEQDLPVQEQLSEGSPDRDIEVPEADAIEQAQPGPLLDEDEMRD